MRKINQIKSDINRAKMQLQQLEDSELFTETDKQSLKPKYEEEIKSLTLKLKMYAH